MTLQEINRFEFVRIDEYNRYIISARKAHNTPHIKRCFIGFTVQRLQTSTIFPWRDRWNKIKAPDESLKIKTKRREASG